MTAEEEQLCINLFERPTEDFTGRVTLVLANNFVTKCRLTIALQHNFFGTTLIWVPLIIEHLNAITDCKFGRHDTEHYNK